jgi:branched-chain amino acid transport system ATP-binding protein
MSLLEVNKLEAFYGASQALFGVDLEIAEGELVALMGRNGMGKTTTVRAITGMLRTTRGEIRFDGHDGTALPSFRAARLGIGLAPEGRRCFANL